MLLINCTDHTEKKGTGHRWGWGWRPGQDGQKRARCPVDGAVQTGPTLTAGNSSVSSANVIEMEIRPPKTRINDGFHRAEPGLRSGHQTQGAQGSIFGTLPLTRVLGFYS